MCEKIKKKKVTEATFILQFAHDDRKNTFDILYARSYTDVRKNDLEHMENI